MRVCDVMTSDPVRVPPSSSMLAARRLLARHRIRHLPVVADDRLVGVVSDRDLDLTDRRVRRVLVELGSDLVSGRSRLVQDVMSVPVHTVASDAPLGAAAALLRQHRIGALPVVGAGRLVGVVTRTDCLRVLERDTADAPPPVVDPVTARTRLVESYAGLAPRSDGPPRGRASRRQRRESVMPHVDVTHALSVAAGSARVVFRGDAGRWLPEPVERRPGPSRWLLYPGAGPVGVAVDARVGEAWDDGNTTWRLLRWEPSGSWSARHLPAFDGGVGVRALPDATASLVLRCSYRPPHGLVGAAADRLFLHRVATATARAFLTAMGQRLALACPPTADADPLPYPTKQTS